MKQLCSDIGFSPENFEKKNDNGDITELGVHSQFTPTARAAVAEVDKAKFSCVNIRNLSKDITIKDLQTLLEEKGLPSGHESISLIK